MAAESGTGWAESSDDYRDSDGAAPRPGRCRDKSQCSYCGFSTWKEPPAPGLLRHKDPL